MNILNIKNKFKHFKVIQQYKIPKYNLSRNFFILTNTLWGYIIRNRGDEKMKNDKCEEYCKRNRRSTYRTEEDKKELTKRLNIIEGQVRGINQMIADDRYCDDVLVQIAAVNKALKSLGNHILESHLKSCVVHDIQMGNLDILEEVMLLIKKLQ